LPDEPSEEIDSAAGPRGPSAFLVETARAELRRLLAFRHSREDLRLPEPNLQGLPSPRPG
jgi:hypothetical protein